MRIGSRLGWLLLASMMAGVLLLSSCSGTTSSSEKSATPADSKPFGSVTVWGNFLTGSIDPIMGMSAGAFHHLGAMVFDSLIELGDNGQPRPGIAERWETAPDGLSTTFYIRKGVKFHDGSDLTGADVKFSLDRTIAPDGNHNNSGTLKGLIDKVELKDDYTVVVRFKTKQYDLMLGSYDQAGNLAVLPKKYIEEKGVDYFRSHPMGSGPWKVAKYEQGTRVEFEAVESHWREVPKYKNLTFLDVKEEATKVAMLKTGELDIAQVSPDSIDTLKSSGLRIVKNEAGGQDFIFMFYDVEHPQQYPFGNVNVRKALSLALNRQEMATSLFKGYASPSAGAWMPKTSFYFDSNVLKPDPYDPEQSKKLLAEAGFPNGFDTKVWQTGVTDVQLMQQAIAGYWRKVGVTANLTAIDFTALRSMYNPKHQPEVWNTAMAYFTGSPGMQFESFTVTYHSTKGSAKVVKDARIDELIDKVPTITDPAEKKKAALEAATLAKNSYGIVPVLDVQTIYAFSSKVGDMKFVAGVPEIAFKYATLTHPK